MNSNRATAPQFLVLIFILALQFSSVEAQQVITENSSGQHGDLYYIFWKDMGDATMTLLGDDGYRGQWNDSTYNWIGGLGLKPLSPSMLSYTGQFAPAEDSSAFVSLYGRSNEPQFEFYVVESFGIWNPSGGGVYYGSYESDGELYDAYYRWEIVGGVNGREKITYYSVRRDIQSPGIIAGTITVDNHVNAWAQMGVDLTTLEYTVLATDSYRGSGNVGLSISSTYGCGASGQRNTCCSTALATVGNGEGTYFDGTSCLINEESVGWHPTNPDEVIAAINVGGLLNAVESEGIWYAPNAYVTGGFSRGTRTQTTDSQANRIYQSAQHGEFSVAIPVTGPSLLSIELGFVHLHDGPNVFDVIVEGKKRLSSVNVGAEVGGNQLWRPDPIAAEVTDGTLNINIVPTEGVGTLSSVLVKDVHLEPQQVTANERGFFGDKYFLYWTDNPDKAANLTLLGNHQFTTDWSADPGQWVGGMGWNPGLESVFEYAGYFNPEDDGNSYLGLMGWTDDPKVSFYIVESWVGSIPGFTEYRTLMGSYESDGAQYDLYRVNQYPPSIEGGYPSYFSIRKISKPTGQISGRVNTAQHFDAWRELGFGIGGSHPILFVTESDAGAGNASITVEEGSLVCGIRDGVASCCDISADPDGDGWGVLQDGRECAVTDETSGWHPSSGSPDQAGDSIGGGAVNIWLLVILLCAWKEVSCQNGRHGGLRHRSQSGPDL